jgi:uncharacterized phage protein (TIGR02220 family)
MPNRQKETAEYFPFVVKEGRTLYALKKKYGLAGIGFFTQIMRLLCMTPGHYYSYLADYDKDRLNEFVGMAETEVKTWLALMVETGKLDRELWETRNVIYSQDLADSLGELYRRRSTECPTQEAVMAETASNCRHIDGNFTEIDIQTRGEKSREEERREEELVGPEADHLSTTSRHVLDYLNQQTGKSFRYSDTSLRPIRARLREGFTLDDCRDVIDAKVREWAGDKKMQEYLRPQTVFGTKFESYLQAIEPEADPYEGVEVV